MASIDKLIVTNRGALASKYGSAASRINDALKALIEADDGRGVTTRVVALDDATALGRYRAKPVSKANDEAGCKDAIDQLIRELTPDYLDDPLFKDVNKPAAEFPAFAFIEPDYLWPGANDDHPPHDVSRGQTLIADVYDALRNSTDPDLWRSTLLVVTYDEHGGFYDHVVPPTDGVVAPDDSPGEDGFHFDQLGVRVPAVLVSPWLDPGVCKERFDHTSVLRCLQNNWQLGDLGRRVAAARCPLEALPLRSTPRSDTPERLPRPPAVKKAVGPKAKAAAPPLSDHQRAIVAFSEYLATQTTAPPKTKATAAAKKLRGSADAGLIARERAERFLVQRGARL